jgi:23S rRNA (cytosine1962-C5)-methyltransferase
MRSRKNSRHKITNAPDMTSPRQEHVAFEGPVAVISRRAADRLRAGHVWVYASDIEQTSVPQASVPDNEPPPLLAVTDSRGILLGTALYSPTSQIALRIISTELIDETRWLHLLAERLRHAIALRRPIFSQGTTACRLVFSEADGLPGLIADKYGDLVLLQLLAKGLDNSAVRTVAVRILAEELAPGSIMERPDSRIRELEQLSAPEIAPLYVKDLEHPLTATTFQLNGLGFHYDANAGQKTGAFLDQRENYAAAARYAFGEALDVCCYQGGFSLHMAKACQRVTGVDQSRTALEVAERNLELNRSSLTAEVDWIEADAFALLRDWSVSGTVYDTIVLDPPAFAKSKRAVEGAIRGYKELNLRALKMLRPGGILVTCSCSHHVSLAEFQSVVAAAAGDAKRRVRLLERRGASTDHPVILNIPETEYLKCLICTVE